MTSSPTYGEQPVHKPGHVFVLHASLTDLACDLALIPTARDMYVEPYWGRYRPGPSGPSDQDVGPARATLARDGRVGDLVPACEGRPAFRYVDVGLGSRPMEGSYRDWALRWLDEGVAAALAAVHDDVGARRLDADRERPLVAVPALGTGYGGFDAVRGEVTAQLLRRCEQAVQKGAFDIAIVCLHRSDFAYLQSLRTEDGAEHLTPEEQDSAASLGALAASGRLSLFLGAGVSKAAGVPDFQQLISKVGLALGHPQRPATAAEAASAAATLITAVGDEAFTEAVEAALGGSDAALLHGLLASSRASSVMTTNFDTLFERSARVTFEHAPGPDVLPWERERRSPWLLKMHGSVGRPGRLVITSEDLRTFNAAERPLASVVQSQLLLNDVLFVGYSLRDPNVQELAAEVRALLHRLGHVDQELGTVLAIEPLGELGAKLNDSLHVIDLSQGEQGQMKAAARRLEIFCDVMLWHATRYEPAWQLDPRYAAVGPDLQFREELRALDVPDGAAWQSLREALAAYGLGRRPG